MPSKTKFIVVGLYVSLIRSMLPIIHATIEIRV